VTSLSCPKEVNPVSRFFKSIIAIPVCPTFILCGRPQSTNKINDFKKIIIDGYSEFCAESGLARLVSCAINGVSCDSQFVWSAIVDYLSGKKSYPGMTDTNHNNKNLKYQVFVGGSCCGTIGNYIFDEGLLTICGSTTELFRCGDFALDLLVLRLASFDTVSKLSTLTSTEDPGSVTAMCMGLYFMRMNLFAVNAKSSLDLHSRVVFIWSSVLWVTSNCDVSQSAHHT
jgi:hypothetical protein